MAKTSADDTLNKLGTVKDLVDQKLMLLQSAHKDLRQRDEIQGAEEMFLFAKGRLASLVTREVSHPDQRVLNREIESLQRLVARADRLIEKAGA